MTSRWRARLALLVILSHLAAFGLFRVASSQTAGEPLPVIGTDVVSATATTVTYVIRVTNFGESNSTGVRAYSTVPANATFESSAPQPSPPVGTPTPPTPAGGCVNGAPNEGAGVQCEWNLGTIAPGAFKEIVATFNLLQTDTTYTLSHATRLTTWENHTNSNTDASLTREAAAAGDAADKDTYVDDTETASFNHGTCPVLKVRKTNTVTSFVDVRPLPADASIETLWSSRLRLTVQSSEYTAEAPATIGAHRITGEWTEGAGSCTGAPGALNDARTGTEPASAPSATSTTQVAVANDVVHWDVTPDLDSAAERTAHRGWELRNEDPDTTAPLSLIEFDAKESPDAAQRPRLFSVYTKPEAASCVDADPETRVSLRTAEPVLEALVTDGVKTSNSAGDACNGTGKPGINVAWDVEDDTPDIYFSATEGTATTKSTTAGDAQPDQVVTDTGADGKTNVSIKLDDPNDTGENQISAKVQGTTDPDPAPESCGLPQRPPDVNCSGESATEDDVKHTWATSTISPTSPGATTPGGNSSGTGTTSPPPQSDRTLTLEASEDKVVSGSMVTFSGEILATPLVCRDADEFIRIHRRVLGSSSYRSIASTSTNSEGRYSIGLRVSSGAEYFASAPGHDTCANSSSSTEKVLVLAIVSARASDSDVRRGDPVVISGSVRPSHPGRRVVLERRTGDGFVRVARRSLSGTSTFRFAFEAAWRRNRVFRVKFVGDADHEVSVSPLLTIRSRARR